MKRIKIILLLFLCSMFTYAQNSFYNKFANMDGVSSVYISKAMLNMVSGIGGADVDIAKIAPKLDNIMVIKSEKSSVIAKMKKEAACFSAKNGYEEMMRVNDSDENVAIYHKKNKGKKNEFVLLVGEKDEFSIIVFTGEMTLKNIKGIKDKL